MSDGVRARLTAVVIRQQQDAAGLYADSHDGRSLDDALLVRIQDKMARVHAGVAEGLDWLADDTFMREWQERCDEADKRRTGNSGGCVLVTPRTRQRLSE